MYKNIISFLVGLESVQDAVEWTLMQSSQMVKDWEGLLKFGLTGICGGPSNPFQTLFKVSFCFCIKFCFSHNKNHIIK